MYRALLLLLCAASAEAQDWVRESLPLQFAQASPRLLTELARDWERLARSGREWAYCVTEWRTDTTTAGDTVFIATRAQLVQTGTAVNVEAFECTDTEGRYIPVIHSHLTGDCSPSRADIHHIIGRRTFGLVICGPRAVAGYVFGLYDRAIRR